MQICIHIRKIHFKICEFSLKCHWRSPKVNSRSPKPLEANHCNFFEDWPSVTFLFTSSDLQYLQRSNSNDICLFFLLYKHKYKKNSCLDVVANVWRPVALMSLNWPLMTSNGILYQSHISYSSFTLYVCIFTKISHPCVKLLRVDLLWPYFDLQWPSIPAEVNFK